MKNNISGEPIQALFLVALRRAQKS